MGKPRAIIKRYYKAPLVLLLMTLAACGGGGGGTPSTFTISGTITPSSGSRVDGDVNDLAYSYTANDTLNTAQAIPNPVTLGGFVSLSGTGKVGDRFANQGDNRDYFRIQLTPGQTVRLTEHNSIANLDLFLYDSSGVEIGFSNSLVALTERVNAPANFTGARDFFIEVRAVAGQSNYTLVTGLTGLSVQDSNPRPTDNFVPGELIIDFRDTILPAGVTVDSLHARAGSVGLQARAGAPGRSMLMYIGNVTQRAQLMQSLGTGVTVKATSTKLQEKLETILALKALRKRPDIKQVRLNYIYQPQQIPNDAEYSSQWHYPLINLPQAWDVTTGSSNVIVAVIDTGVLLNHPDFAGKLVPGYDFIKDAAVARDGDGIDANPDDPGDRGYGVSSTFHGTHVAGTIGAASNNTIGVAGVGWNVKIMPLRALGLGGGTTYDIEQAILFAAGLPNDSNTVPGQRADVINLSVGGPGGAGTTPKAYVDARSKAGVIIVASAGNDSSSVPVYPASYNGVVSVSAVNLSKGLAFYSSFGPYVDVAAPGGDASTNLNGDRYPDGVMSTQGSDAGGTITFGYGIKQGTSMAAPHIAGVVALMKSVHPGLTPAEFDAELQSEAITEDLGTARRDDRFGWGLIDALKAVLRAQLLAGGTPPANNPFLVVSPGSLNFATSGTSTVLDVRNAGTGTLTVSSPTEDSGGWLTVTETNVDANKLGNYTVTIDRTGLANGTYTATITYTSNANTVKIPIIMQVQSASVFDDAGLQYILLYDPATSSVVTQVTASAANGTYSYSFKNVAAGTYQLYAGTDFDNDGFICSPGESCGVYPDTSSNQTNFKLNADLLNADFITGYTTGITGSAVSATAGIKKASSPKQPFQ